MCALLSLIYLQLLLLLLQCIATATESLKTPPFLMVTNHHRLGEVRAATNLLLALYPERPGLAGTRETLTIYLLGQNTVSLVSFF